MFCAVIASSISLPQWGKGDRLRWMRCFSAMFAPRFRGFADEKLFCRKRNILRGDSKLDSVIRLLDGHRVLGAAS